MITHGTGEEGQHGKYGEWAMLRAGGKGKASKERDQGGGSRGRRVLGGDNPEEGIAMGYGGGGR